MTILPIASIIASFLAGIAALFAPCCITVLLPSYIASIFSQRKKVLAMTGVFSLGLLTIFLPIGLGAAALGQFFAVYHDQIYILGALFLFFLGAAVLLGKSFSLPWHTNVGTPQILTFGSIFTLGIFSGFATSCCAPVLAGIVTLSVLPGSLFLGGLYATFYVLGMVAPLFILAYVLDKTQLTQRFWLMRKTVSYKLLGRVVTLTVSNLLTAIIFLGMGTLILYLALTKNLQMEAASGLWIRKINSWILGKFTDW